VFASTFNGTNADEIITPNQVSPTVKVIGTPGAPSDADDIINAGGGNDVIDASAVNLAVRN
jgi:hypothetical protein